MSEIIGKSYNPYAMPSGGHGLASGFAMGRQIAKERGLANGVKAYVDAEANGDKIGMQKAIGLMAGVAPAETMDWLNKQKALEQKNLERQFNTTNEIKNINDLMGRGYKQDEAVKLAYKQQDTYKKEKERQQALLEAKEEQSKNEKLRNAQQTSSDLFDTISFVEKLPDKIVGPYSGGLNIVGAYTGGNYGFSDDEQMLKGELDRRVGEIENQIIAVARQNGQTGINTMAEIRQAAKGIASARSKPALLGALRHMYNLQQKYIQMGNSGMVDDDGAMMTTIPNNNKQEIISFDDWVKQGE